MYIGQVRGRSLLIGQLSRSNSVERAGQWAKHCGKGRLVGRALWIRQVSGPSSVYRAGHGPISVDRAGQWAELYGQGRLVGRALWLRKVSGPSSVDRAALWVELFRQGRLWGRALWIVQFRSRAFRQEMTVRKLNYGKCSFRIKISYLIIEQWISWVLVAK